MINDKYKCMFIHINKNAGTSIDTLFNGSHQQHFSIKGYESFKRSKLIYPHCYKFTVVRNPWDKMVSLYHSWAKSSNWDWGWGSDNKPTFIEFIKIIDGFSSERQMEIWPELWWYPHKSGTMRMSNQLDWLIDSNNKIPLNYICRFENLQEDFNKVCDDIGFPKTELPHRQKSNHLHYSTYYDEETKDIVARRFSKDIEYFGYKFNSSSKEKLI